MFVIKSGEWFVSLNNHGRFTGTVANARDASKFKRTLAARVAIWAMDTTYCVVSLDMEPTR